MKIAIDARVAERPMTGIGRYLVDLLKGISSTDSGNEYSLFTTTPIDNYDKNFFNNVVLDKAKVKNKIYSPLWLNFILKNYLLENKFNIFFSPNNLCPISVSGKLKSIVTVHDVMFMLNKAYYPFFYRQYLNVMLKRSLNSAEKIITISNNSKNDIIKHFRLNKEKVEVIYNSAGHKFKPRFEGEFNYENLIKKYGLKNDYILYVGVVENRKNISGILQIADLVAEKNRALQFVIAGKPGHGFGNIKKAIDKRKDNVRYLNFVDEEDLPLLYNAAKIFLFPSFYEGFGYPVLEAMQSGIPVVTSNTSSLPEIVEGFGIMHEPDDIISFTGSIFQLLEEPNYYELYCQKSVEGARRFSQTKFIKAHIELFNGLS